MRDAVAITIGDSFISAVPSDEEGLSLAYTLDYPESSVRSQYLALKVDADSFSKSIAPARTFCFESEIEELRKRGLGQGASAENTIVVRNNGSAPDGNPPLRFGDELVRHKVLDLMGDLFLLGADLKGRVVATTDHRSRSPTASWSAACSSSSRPTRRRRRSKRRPRWTSRRSSPSCRTGTRSC